jgi:hypothetical protein
VALGLGAALLLNLVLILAVTQLDTSFQSSSEAHAYLGVKVLAGIPYCLTARQATRERVKAALIATAGATYTLAVFAYLFWDRVGPRLRGGG